MNINISLGTPDISRRKAASTQPGPLCDKLSFAAAEAYKLLRTNLQFVLPEDKSCKVIGITSPLRNEGKSTTSVNLSYTIAQSGKRVLLIDGDMRLPTIHQKLSMQGSPGLSNLLAGLNEEREVLQVSKYYRNWYIMAAGDIPPNPSELLGSEKMQAALEHLSGYFDFIVVDLPPVNIVSDALVASRWTDGLIVAARQNVTTGHSLQDCMYQIEAVHANFLGYVMTGVAVGEGAYKRYSKYGKYGKGKYARYGYGYSYGNYGGYGNNSYGGNGKKKVDKETSAKFYEAITTQEQQDK